MKVEKLIEEIYDFEGNAEEWLLFEEQVKKEIKEYSSKEMEQLEESDAMEHLMMICDGIRFSEAGNGKG